MTPSHRALLDPATAALLEQLRTSGQRPLWELTPEQARERGPRLAAAAGPGPELYSVRDEHLADSAGGSLRVRILMPSPLPTAVVVWFHGGGWVTGDIDQFDAFGRTLARRSGAAVVLADYRKAPEFPYPAPVEDAWSALTWVATHSEPLVGAPVPLVVGGDSAGGNLAAVVALRARDRGGPRLAMQVLAYPVTDADFSRESYRDPENQLLVPRRSMEWFWNHYLPAPHERLEPEASPLRADSLEGLPPTTLLTAGYDVLRDEGDAYAGRLAASGVNVDHRCFASETHGFLTLTNILPGSHAGIDHIATTMDTVLGRKSHEYH